MPQASARSTRPQPFGADAPAADAVLTVDLGAIRANYRKLCARLGGFACAAVVKADAYGLGAAAVAPALAREGCDTFFVAQLTEGIALRDVLGNAPTIYILNGLMPGNEEACLAAGLLPVLNSAAQARAWAALGRQAGRPLPAALQVDSGMARLGLAPEEFAAVLADADCRDFIDVRLAMSHLARADELAHPANATQREAFERLRAALPGVPASLANSSGNFLGDGFRYDLARPGAALYGINPTPGASNPMRPVVKLAARIIQTREVPAGAGIGYAHAAIAEKPMRLATIALGYADGWHRNAAAAAFHEGQRLPFVGRVSMDSIILDISSLPAGTLKGGDPVELIGEQQSVDDVAAIAGTIGYEILTSLGSRFQRIYLDGGEA